MTKKIGNEDLTHCLLQFYCNMPQVSEGLEVDTDDEGTLDENLLIDTDDEETRDENLLIAFYNCNIA